MTELLNRLGNGLFYKRNLPVCEEFLLYGYPIYEANQFGRNKWHFIAAYPAAEACLESAQHLLRSAGYQRLEIKRRYICARNQKTYFTTYSVLGKRLKRHKIMIAGSIMIALLCAFQYFFNILSFF